MTKQNVPQGTHKLAKNFGRQRGTSYRHKGDNARLNPLHRSPGERMREIERRTSPKPNRLTTPRLATTGIKTGLILNKPMAVGGKPITGLKPGATPGLSPAVPGNLPKPAINFNGLAGASAAVVMKPGLRFVPLGGLEEVGRNMMAIEYHDEIVIVDMGLQFPEGNMPGIDYIIPNVEYLVPRAKYVRGVVITHGHYDHIGAIPHLMGKVGNPPMYTSALTRGIVLKRMADFPDAPKMNIQAVKAGQIVAIGKHFRVEFVHVNHNIPDSFALAVHTPAGTMVHTGDFKFDLNPINEAPADLSGLERLGNQGVLMLTSDSTDVEEPGSSIPEAEIKNNMEEIFTGHLNQRLIFATFSSLLSRVQQVFDLAYKHGRKVAVDGFSMRSNVEIARELGYLKTARDVQIDIKDIDKYKPNQVVIMCTGAQGEGNAVLMRIAQREHKSVRITPDDIVIFSSSVIPGNERAVQGLKDVIYRQGAKVIHYKLMDIHAGGHAAQEDLKKMLALVRPKYFFPVHGNYYMLKLHAELAQRNGVLPANTFILNNGDCAHVSQENVTIERNVAPTNYVFVDGLGVGDVGEIVIRDRQKMAEDGMFVIITTLDSKTAKIRNKIDIISRGFVYMNESKDLMLETRRKVKEIVERSAGKEYTTNWSYVKDRLRDEIGELLYHKTHRRPLILPVVLEV